MDRDMDVGAASGNAQLESGFDRRSYLRLVGGVAAFTTLGATSSSPSTARTSPAETTPTYTSPVIDLDTADEHHSITFDSADTWQSMLTGDTGDEAFTTAAGYNALRVNYPEREELDASVEYPLAGADTAHIQYDVFIPDGWTFSTNGVGGIELPGLDAPVPQDDTTGPDGDEPDGNDPDTAPDDGDDGTDDNTNPDDGDEDGDSPVSPGPFQDGLFDSLFGEGGFFDMLFDALFDAFGGSTDARPLQFARTQGQSTRAAAFPVLPRSGRTAARSVERGLPLDARIFHSSSRESGEFDSMDHSLTTGQWHQIDLFLELNEPDQTDGRVACWVDGNLALRRHSLRFRTEESQGIDAVQIAPAFIGTVSPVKQYFYLRDLDVYTWGSTRDDKDDSKEPREVDTTLSLDHDHDALETGWQSGGKITFDGPPATSKSESSLRAHHTGGTHGSSARRYAFADNWGYEPEECYAKFYLRFGEDFESDWDGKLPGFSSSKNGCGHGGAGTDGSCWSARMCYDEAGSGPIPVGFYYYHLDTDRYGSFAWSGEELQRGQWYEIEQHIEMNTPGEYDGTLQMWIDGDLVIDEHEIAWRGSGYEDVGIERMWIDFYHGGNTVAPSDFNIFVDWMQLNEDSRIRAPSKNPDGTDPDDGEQAPPEQAADAYEEYTFADTDWHDDFTNINYPEKHDVVSDSERGDVTQIQYDAGGYYGSSALYPTEQNLGWEPLTMHARFWIKFDENWTFADAGPGGTKLPGWAGTYPNTQYEGGWGGRETDGSTGWSVRQFNQRPARYDDADSGILFGSQVYHVEHDGAHGAHPRWDETEGVVAERGEWHRIDLYTKMNNPETSDSDAVHRVWVDGKLALDYTGIRFRDDAYAEDIKCDKFWLNFYFGGGWGSPITQHVRISDLQLWMWDGYATRNPTDPDPRQVEVE